MNPNKIVWSEEKEKLKRLPFKEKLRYIWMYFRIPIVAIIFVLVFGTFLIVRIATNIPDNWLMVTFANTYADAGTGSRLWKDFTTAEGYDLKEKKVEFNASSYFDYTKDQARGNAYYNTFITLADTGELDAVMLLMTLILIYTFPSIAAFEGRIPNHIRNAIYFAFHKPWWIPVNLFFHVFPLYLTYSDPQLMPLYAFCWFFFGFGAIVMLTARLLIKDYNKYLPIVDDFGDFILTEDGKQIMPGSEEEKALYEDGGVSFGGHDMTDEEMIKELEKLDM